MTTVEIAPDAQSDIVSITEGLAVDAGKAVALRYGAEFVAAVRQLSEFPRLGAPRPKFGAEVRLWTIHPYVLYYRYSARTDRLLVLRIVHGRRKVTRRLLSGGRP